MQWPFNYQLKLHLPTHLLSTQNTIGYCQISICNYFIVGYTNYEQHQIALIPKYIIGREINRPDKCQKKQQHEREKA